MVRICGDYRETVNANTEADQYPLPRLEELFSNITGGKVFTVFDLKDAYLQQPVDDESSKILTLNTHRGLFRVLRLPFGVKSAPGLFQRKMENLLKPLKKTSTLLDDVITTGTTEEDHIRNVETILECFSQQGLRLSKDKFRFMLPEVKYLGHVISEQGISPLPEKVEAIVKAPNPEDVSQLRAYLGLLNYYRGFLPDVANMLEPLYRLTDSSVKWNWQAQHEKAFKHSKELLTKAPVLEHFDVQKPVVLHCDASQYGIGVVLSHVIDGKEKPIAYASRTMNKAERNYAQVDKEALAVIFGVKKFHQYVAGRSFKILTDHKPLLRLLHPNIRVPETLSPRMLRWTVLLSGYDYELEYRPGRQHGNADALSRLPIVPGEGHEDVPDPFEVCFISEPDTIATSEEIGKWISEDRTLKQVRSWCLEGWPEGNVSEEFTAYIRRKDAISLCRDCLLWGSRVIIPLCAREKVLKMLHSTHQGICAMKAKARSMVWWPNLDKDIEQVVQQCLVCQQIAHDPPRTSPPSWKSSNKVWDRIHIDHAGPVRNGKYYLIVVDSYSNWIEVRQVPSTSSESSIRVLRSLFATFGLPRQVVADNGTSFTSVEFQSFMKRNGIRLTLIPPYHPASNGQAERTVQTFKKTLQKMPGGYNELNVKRFLLDSHTTPHSITKKTPAELMFNRELRTALSILKPEEEEEEVERDQPRLHAIKKNDQVFLRNFRKGQKWITGEVIKLKGSKWLMIKRTDGIVCRRHIDHVRKNHSLTKELDELEDERRILEQLVPRTDDNSPSQPVSSDVTNQTGRIPSPEESTENIAGSADDQGSPDADDPNRCVPIIPQQPSPCLSTLRRSSRIKRPVQRLNL